MEQQQTSRESVTATTNGKSSGGLFRNLLIIIVLLLLAGGAYFYFSSNAKTDGEGENQTVATVNGVAITQKDVDDRIERTRETLLTQGTDISDPTVRAGVVEQTITQIVNEMLVLEDAKRSGITVTGEEIDTEFANIKARFESEEAFKTELAKNYFTEETLRVNIERELITQKYVQKISADAQIEVTEDEITALYAQAKEQNADIPPLEDVRAEAENQIRNQKLAVLVSSAVEGLRADADIVITKRDTVITQ